MRIFHWMWYISPKMWNLDLYQNGGIYHHFMPLEHGENKVFNFKPWDGMVYYPVKDIEPQQSVGTHGVGVVCWAWYLAQECPRCWICQSVGDKSHTGFGVLWGSSNEDQQKQPNEGRKRTDTPHSYCLHIGPTPVPAFPMTRWLCTDPFPQRGWHRKGETPKLRRAAATDGGTILKGLAIYLVSGTFGFDFFPQNGNSM